MKCPECQVLNEPNATACAACGLLLVLLAAPKRRADDLFSQRRRASDTSKTTCALCRGEIDRDSVRCKHCGEIVDPEYRQRSWERRRANLNHASWVAYVFGLLALLVFRPVGIISIAAGLILSIAYYAIPLPSEPLEKPAGWRDRFRRIGKRFRSGKVALPLPAFRRKRLIFVGTPLVAALAGFLANFLLLQQPLDEVIEQNASFRGMDISAHYEYWIVPGVVVYDLKNLEPQHSPLHVQAAFLEYTRKLKELKVRRVELSHDGVQKFSLAGTDLRSIASDYEKRDFAKVLFDLPRLVKPKVETSGSHSTAKDALIEFHRQWYLDDHAR
jgi:hypothetical protein